MGRVDELVEATGGIAEMVDRRSAWQAAAIVSEGFPARAGASGGGPLGVVVNWFRLTFLSRAIINRDRTAVIGVGGTRLGAIVAIAVVGAWAAPRLPKSVVVATTGLVAVAAMHRSRLRRLLWLTATLRRDAPDAILVGEFAAREPGAGVAFAAEVLDAIGTRVTLALTVQGTRGGRRARSLVRLYERRLQFETVARHSVGDDEVVLMVRRASTSRTQPVAAVS
ncbi:MAG TPA: hypothetical protein VLV81_07840 [Acidimicrobiia bacterium]|nr:hypothetical protein [Acidimicrobiia bacterium]